MSHNSSTYKTFITILEGMKFNKVLDVGAGWGHNGATIRVHFEYEDVIDALELYKPWVEGLKKSMIYNRVIHDDAKNLLKYRGYDLYILGDIIEHLEYEDSIKIIKGLLDVDANVIILTPNANRRKIKQRSLKHYTGNILMKHHSGFTINDFDGYKCIIVPINEIPWYFKPLYDLVAIIKGRAVISSEIVAFRCIK